MNRTVPLVVITILVFGFVMHPSVFGSNEKKEDKEFKIPSGLSEIAPGVFSLGKSKDVNGNEVEGIMFIHSKKEFVKPTGAGKPTGTTCYAFLTKGGVKWTTPEPWVVNPLNSGGLDSGFILGNIAYNIAKWEDASNGVIGDNISVNIMGDGSSTNTVLVADSTNPDNQNEIYFANISSSGTIAVTTTWYNTFTKQIVEMDQVFDDVDYDWSDSTVNGVASKMDFENISNHELGHGIGMGHPSDSCSNETMYRYASFAETKKRDLNTGDIAGINALY